MNGPERRGSKRRQEAARPSTQPWGQLSSLQARRTDVMDREAGSKGWGEGGGGHRGGTPEQSPGEQAWDSSARVQDGSGRAVGQESTGTPICPPAWPEALRGSWREARRAGQEKELLEDRAV